MSPAEFLAELARLGFTLTQEGAGIRITPADRLTEDLRRTIRAHKADLLALLRTGAAAEGSGRCERGHTLDSRGRCWRCCDRLCSDCGRSTGSAFVQRCTGCGWRFNGNRGEPL
jgi:hypothetical protein